ncbi:ATP-dependent DNA helicase MER3 [Karstenula rhodostoma CBS 690.94]|uniref:DNA 3'-5' helicase n=1 Tax=Karstenula rhodostoma CBS 690.94 TaxID=1392251 RepID=A0A9P4UHJ9_9PLEO|nr:ATP-dependent DNA helicase MER3 [Karstenula rhodostoma CBS 690.94]
MSFAFRDRLEGQEIESDARQYPILQPQFKQPARSQAVPPRDRYRAPRPSVLHDGVEEDGTCRPEQPLDSFDERMLQQSHVDRQSKAIKGQARLSFPPQSGKSSAPAVSSQVPCLYRFKTKQRDDVDGQFVHEPTQPLQGSSSDVPLGVSSSPAFMAGQRHIGATQKFAQPTLQPRHYKQEDVFETTYSQEEFPHPRHHSSAAAEGLRPNARYSAPITQGIQQVPVAELPDRLRTIFPYPIFNAVQSKCFDAVYGTDENFVLSSPTGSGKTVVLELAICRAISKNSTGQYKIIYQAPTKALCSERQRDWQKKFGPLNLDCVELTGDSESVDLRNIQSANIIITTPEKWDSITRKWKDHEKLMRLVNLFLIDEVHLLKEDRGATLEVVVSRMKSIGTDVRFVALSATVPNFPDVATWLGKSSAEPYEPATNENFGEEFRPVKLRKHVCGYQSSANDFAFEKTLDTKLPDVVRNFSGGKPIMVFCFTRKSTIATAKVLARHAKYRAWKLPTKPLSFRDRDLRECAASGVAFHHAGIDSDDRIKVEKAYLEGELSVICCTSTLAVGVNLPCHLVIIKNTVSFTQNGVQEYSDLEVMQMLGRAGRPQFDDSAVAVIMTRQNKVRKYELMVTGQEVLESTLHLGLIDHLNAEIGLGTIRDLDSARKWLASTFLYVRIRQNPAYYKLEGSRSGQSIDEQLDDICFRDITLLRQHNLMTGEELFRSTKYGHAMAQYYIQFDSMRIFMGLPPKATMSEILSAIAQTSEFATIRFRSGEKSLYKSINNSPYIRFPIPVNLDLPAHKVSLLIQSILGGADISWDGENVKHRTQYNTEALVIFKQTNRLIRCIIDCQIYAGDSVSINNALILERSLSARVWDDSPIQMKQIETLGIVGCRKLAQAGIRSLEELESTEAHRIEHLLGRNPPYGLKILEKVKVFPKLRVSLQLQPSTITKTPGGIKVLVKTDIGFINEKPPEKFAGKAVYVCLLAETSDGRKVHFARLSAKKLGNGQSLTIPVLLTSPNLSINCHIMCDGIAGTMRTASVTPKIAASMFPSPKSESTPPREQERPSSNISRRRTETPSISRKSVDEFDDGIDDDEFVKASLNDLSFDHIDNYANPTDAITRVNTANNATKKDPLQAREQEDQEPRQLENGKWACNHPCKDKDACKHLCCKQGMDKPPKKAAPKRVLSRDDRTDLGGSISGTAKEKGKKTQSMLQLTASKRKSSATIEELDLTHQEKNKKAKYAKKGPSDFRELNKLHRDIQKKDPPSSGLSIMHQKPSYCYGQGGTPDLSFLGRKSSSERPGSVLSSDYGDVRFDDVSTDSGGRQISNEGQGDMSICITAGQSNADRDIDLFDEEDSMLEDILLGVADSEDLKGPADNNEIGETGFDLYQHDDYDLNYLEHRHLPTADSVRNSKADVLEQNVPTSSPIKVPMVPPEKGRSLFLNDSSSYQTPYKIFQSTRPMLKGSKLEEYEHENDNHDEEPTRASKFFETKVKSSDEEVKFVEDTEINVSVKEEGDLNVTYKLVPDAYQGLEPWLFHEFGDIVEIVD